jgi:hypothetical protein|tara:strand:+ start:1785 stop:1982 length:198 start_codon:yes stop_codon:yes gene_type:complete
MDLITKPDIKDWPNEIKFKVAGIPILIDYKKDLVLLPKTERAFELQDGIAQYLQDEGFIETQEKE